MSDVLNIDEACEYLKLARSTIYRFTRAGIIPHIRIGRSLRFKKEVLDEWLRRQAEEGIAKPTMKHTK